MHRRCPTRPKRGATVVEFALTLPLLLLVVGGLIELVRLHNLRHAADNAAYEAARHVIVPGANVNEAVTQANDLLARAGVRRASVLVNPAVIGEDDRFVTVQVSVPLVGNSWLPPKVTAGRMVVRQTTLRTERTTAVQGEARATPGPTPAPPTPGFPRPGTGGSRTGGFRPGGSRTDGGGLRPSAGGSSRPRSGAGGGSGAGGSRPLGFPPGGSGGRIPGGSGAGGGRSSSGGQRSSGGIGL